MSPLALKKANLLHTRNTSAFCWGGGRHGSPGTLPSIWPWLPSLFIYTFPFALLSVQSTTFSPLVTDPPILNRWAPASSFFFITGVSFKAHVKPFGILPQVFHAPYKVPFKSFAEC